MYDGLLMVQEAARRHNVNSMNAAGSARAPNSFVTTVERTRSRTNGAEPVGARRWSAFALPSRRWPSSMRRRARSSAAAVEGCVGASLAKLPCHSDIVADDKETKCVQREYLQVGNSDQ